MKESMSQYIFNACPDFWILEFKKSLQINLGKIFLGGCVFYFHESINQWDDDTFQQKK